MKAQLKEHLSLSKKDWNGMLVLLVLIVLVLAAPYFYRWFHKDSTINVKAFNEAVAALDRANPHHPVATSLSGNTPVALFKFNPNHLPAKKWKQLGLTEKQIITIAHYEAKGGRFNTTEDLRKIYGITDTDFKRLAPYIDLPKYERSATSVVVELNTADSAKLTTIEGIGPAFARRIIYYRMRLGGFVDKAQLKEVAGIDAVKFEEIKDQVKVDASSIKTIEINTVLFDQLRLMPYLNYKQVNAIIEYRAQHGNYHSIDDLQNIPILDAAILRKIEPYLNFK